MKILTTEVICGNVIPTQVGIHNMGYTLDSRFHGNDGSGIFQMKIYMTQEVV